METKYKKRYSCLKTWKYKGVTIIKAVDQLEQEVTFILGVFKSFASVADAKRYINGEPTRYEVIHGGLTKIELRESMNAFFKTIDNGNN